MGGVITSMRMRLASSVSLFAPRRTSMCMRLTFKVFLCFCAGVGREGEGMGSMPMRLTSSFSSFCMTVMNMSMLLIRMILANMMTMMIMMLVLLIVHVHAEDSDDDNDNNDNAAPRCCCFHVTCRMLPIQMFGVS